MLQSTVLSGVMTGEQARAISGLLEEENLVLVQGCLSKYAKFWVAKSSFWGNLGAKFKF